MQEETGYRAAITSFAAPIIYSLNGRLKIVRFWSMQVQGDTRFQPSQEVDAFVWLPAVRAYERLDYVQERRLLTELFPQQLELSPQ